MPRKLAVAVRQRAAGPYRLGALQGWLGGGGGLLPPHSNASLPLPAILFETESSLLATDEFCASMPCLGDSPSLTQRSFRGGGGGGGATLLLPFVTSVDCPRASSCLTFVTQRDLWSYRSLTSPFSFCALYCLPPVPTCNSPAFLWVGGALTSIRSRVLLMWACALPSRSSLIGGDAFDQPEVVSHCGIALGLHRRRHYIPGSPSLPSLMSLSLDRRRWGGRGLGGGGLTGTEREADWPHRPPVCCAHW